jgi:hypothetical protein
VQNIIRLTGPGADVKTWAERHRGIVPIAFRVDYFNDLWKDAFSDSLYDDQGCARGALKL